MKRVTCSLPQVEGAIGRRLVLKSGLVVFATTMVTRSLGGCADGKVSDLTNRDRMMSGADEALDAGSGSNRGPGNDPDIDADASIQADGSVGQVPDGGDFPDRSVVDMPTVESNISNLGPLRDPDENGLRLPEGFTSRVVAKTGERVTGTNHTWHGDPDGGATFITKDGGWIYVSNSEISSSEGGVGALRFSATGEIVGAYTLLRNTTYNCAGGPTPWNTWLSCEETARGQVYECDPWGETEAAVRPALGAFTHEAVTVDPQRGHLYLTEDKSDGCFYRFTASKMKANGYPDLSAGKLEVAVVSGGGSVTWRQVPDPTYSGSKETRYQVAEATSFNGGEGIWYHEGLVYFSTKGDNRIWKLDVAASTLEILYDEKTHPTPFLTGVDNLTVSCCGDVLVAEDSGSMEIVAILPSGELRSLVQVTGQSSSEITGPAFDPSGTRLYFSSQRGPNSRGGITYEVTGPFHVPAK